MQWHITVKPTSVALTDWYWTAISDDQNEYLDGHGYETGTEALAEARAAVDEFEARVLIIVGATIEEDYTPPVPPEPVPEG